MTYPYQQDRKGNLFPIIPVRLFFKNRIVDSSALIDSGATISVFKEDVAENLRIKIEGGKEVFLGGVGGRIKGYVHKIDAEIAGKRLSLPVVFSYEYLVSLNLLGRSLFFEKFLITFNEKGKELSLK